MKLSKAIEIKEEHLHDNQPYDLPDLEDADKLSIEALKFRQACKKRGIRFATFPLPGETEEGD